MKKATALILFWVMPLHLLAQQNIPFVVAGDIFESDLNGYLFTAKNLKFNKIEDLVSLKRQFKKVQTSVANFGVNEDENWIYFELKSQKNKQLVLLLDQVFLEKADLYQFQGDSLVQKIELNYRVDIEKRPFGMMNFNFPIAASQKQVNSIFLRLKSDRIHGISRAMLHLFDEKSFHQYLLKKHLFSGIFYGILVLALFIGFLLYFASPKNIYLIYSVHIVFTLGYYLANYGFLNFLNPGGFVGSPQMMYAFYTLSPALQLLFIQRFLSLKTHFSNTFNQFINGFVGYMLLLFFIYVFLPNFSFLPVLSRLSLVFLGFLLIFICAWAITRKEKTAILYLIATIPNIVLIVYYLLSTLQILPFFANSFNFSFPFTIFEILVFGFGLVYQFTEEKHEIERKLIEERLSVSKEIITAQEQERQRIAQDLHDDLGSTLSMLKNKLSENYEDTLEMQIADKAVDDLRLISHNLMPATFLIKGLKEAIEELVFLNNKAGKMDVSFMCSGVEKKLDWEVELSIFRIVKELVNNAIKHAKSKKIEVQMLYFETFMYVSVEDDGIGMEKFNPAFSSGIGIKNILLRVNYLKGKINQESSQRGTLIAAEIPYDQAKNQTSAS